MFQRNLWLNTQVQFLLKSCDTPLRHALPTVKGHLGCKAIKKTTLNPNNAVYFLDVLIQFIVYLDNQNVSAGAITVKGLQYSIMINKQPVLGCL